MFPVLKIVPCLVKLDDYNSDQQERIFEAETVRAIANRPQTNSVHGSRPGTKDSQIEGKLIFIKLLLFHYVR